MGKQHGSITRAGKVKKQTPHVEKKDRLRKLLVGRAKKRKQYQKKASVLAPGATAAMKKKYRSNKQEDRK